MFKSTNPIGTFRTKDLIGRFNFNDPVDNLHLRQHVSKFVAGGISDNMWHNYEELRALRLEAYSIDETDEAANKEYDIKWNEFCNGLNDPDEKGRQSTKFGLALIVERAIHKNVDPWA